MHVLGAHEINNIASCGGSSSSRGVSKAEESEQVLDAPRAKKKACAVVLGKGMPVLMNQRSQEPVPSSVLGDTDSSIVTGSRSGSSSSCSEERDNEDD
jgi:hypothetical protein